MVKIQQIRKTVTKQKSIPETVARKMEDREILKDDLARRNFGDPIQVRGNILKRKEGKQEIPLQHGIYYGISRDPGRYKIDFPKAVADQMGDIYCDDPEVGVREVKRYVAEKLFIGCAPKAVPA